MYRIILSFTWSIANEVTKWHFYIKILFPLRQLVVIKDGVICLNSGVGGRDMSINMFTQWTFPHGFSCTRIQLVTILYEVLVTFRELSRDAHRNRNKVSIFMVKAFVAGRFFLSGKTPSYWGMCKFPSVKFRLHKKHQSFNGGTKLHIGSLLYHSNVSHTNGWRLLWGHDILWELADNALKH